MTTNSAQLKGDDGKYEKLPICPICNEKVHFEDKDVNYQAWSFTNGDFAHDECFTEEWTNESGEYWNGTEMVYKEVA